MAFNVTAQKPTMVQNEGVFAPIATGVVALSNGTAVVTIPQFQRVEVAFVSSQTANAARVSATSGNTFTITGTSSDVVMWMAKGVARL